MDIYIARNGKTRGPFAKDRLRGMLKSGGVQPIDLAWTEKTGGWTPLYKIAGVVPQTPATEEQDGVDQATPTVAEPRSEKTTRARSSLKKACAIFLCLIGPLFLGSIVFLAFGPLDVYKLLRTIRGVDAKVDRSDSSTMFPKASDKALDQEICRCSYLTC